MALATLCGLYTPRRAKNGMIPTHINISGSRQAPTSFTRRLAASSRGLMRSSSATTLIAFFSRRRSSASAAAYPSFMYFAVTSTSSCGVKAVKSPSQARTRNFSALVNLQVCRIRSQKPNNSLYSLGERGPTKRNWLRF